jgi:predicted transcriptional regulator
MDDSTATDEAAFIRTLRSLGVNHNLSAVVTYLAGVDQATAKEIQNETGISQSGVSKSMKVLRELGWVDEQESLAAAKGRPRKIYALNISLEEVVRHFEAQKLQESAQAMRSIERLRELAGSVSA